MAKKAKVVEHRVTGAELAAAPDLAQEGVQEGDLVRVTGRSDVIEHRVTNADLNAAPELVLAGVREGDLIEIEPTGNVPTYTLQADNPFHLRCMIMIRDMAVSAGNPDKAAISQKLREFDLYEELHRVAHA